MKASQRAYTSLLEEILDGSLAPGTMMSEVEQSERLGISRTPFREALSLLYSDGLVTKPSGRGVYVTSLSVESISKLYAVRRALEECAARLAAHNADPVVFQDLADSFHRAHTTLADTAESIDAYYLLNRGFDHAIDTTVENHYLVAALTNIRMHSQRARNIARSNIERLRASAEETRCICHAIAEKDAELAAHATHIHLHHSLAHVLSTVSSDVTPESRS